MTEVIYKQEAYTIIGACFEVYNEKGCGFHEPVYQECLEIELTLQNVPWVSQKPLPLFYKGRPLRQSYQPDFICFDKIILEIKAVERICDEHRAQVLNYLNATDYALGILLNFGCHPKLEWERIAHTQKTRSSLVPPKFRF